MKVSQLLESDEWNNVVPNIDIRHQREDQIRFLIRKMKTILSEFGQKLETLNVESDDLSNKESLKDLAKFVRAAISTVEKLLALTTSEYGLQLRTLLIKSVDYVEFIESKLLATPLPDVKLIIIWKRCRERIRDITTELQSLSRKF